MYFMTGAPADSNENISGEAGIELATPGLQGIGLIHYNTAASRRRLPDVIQILYNSSKMK